MLSVKQESAPQYPDHFPKKETFLAQDELSLRTALHISQVIPANYTQVEL